MIIRAANPTLGGPDPAAPLPLPPSPWDVLGFLCPTSAALPAPLLPLLLLLFLLLFLLLLLLLLFFLVLLLLSPCGTPGLGLAAPLRQAARVRDKVFPETRSPVLPGTREGEEPTQ